MNRSRAGVVCAAAVMLTLTSAVAPLGAAPPRADDDLGPARVLAVEAVRGNATLQRRGDTVTLQQGYLVFNGETVSTREGTRLSLSLSRHGEMQLGAGALMVEKLPPGPAAKDLDTRLFLERGHLHLRWQYENDLRSWPLTVRLGAWGARVRNGEYHFEARDGRLVVCNVSGAVELYPDSGAGSRTVRSGTCLQLLPGAPQVLTATADDWALALRDLNLNAVVSRATASIPHPVSTASTPVAAQAPVSEPASASASASSPEAEPAPEPTPVAVAAAEPEPSPEQLIATAPTSAGPVVVSEIAQVGAEVRVVYTEPGGEVDPRNDWMINVVSVRDAGSADDYAKSLAAAGYPARVRSETVRGRPSFRVVVPGIQNGAAAEGVAEQLRTQLGFVDAWVLQRR